MRKIVISVITTAALFAIAGASAADMLAADARSVSRAPNPRSIHGSHDGPSTSRPPGRWA